MRPGRHVASIPILLVAALWILLDQPAMGAETKNVLVVYSNNRLVPGNVAVDRGLRAELTSSSDGLVHTFSEFLDRPEFSGVAYERTMTTYFREKYAARSLDQIVEVSAEEQNAVLLHAGDSVNGFLAGRQVP
jgi:hypothetical protein